jgi:hypothetical protein
MARQREVFICLPLAEDFSQLLILLSDVGFEALQDLILIQPNSNKCSNLASNHNSSDSLLCLAYWSLPFPILASLVLYVP